MQQALKSGMQRLVNTVVAPKVKAAIDLLPLAEYHFSEVRRGCSWDRTVLAPRSCYLGLMFILPCLGATQEEASSFDELSPHLMEARERLRLLVDTYEVRTAAERTLLVRCALLLLTANDPISTDAQSLLIESNFATWMALTVDCCASQMEKGIFQGSFTRVRLARAGGRGRCVVALTCLLVEMRVEVSVFGFHF